MKPVTVVIIDPVTPVRLGLKALLSGSKTDFRVVGEYRDMPSFREAAVRRVDMILVNPCTVGFSASFDIRKLLPDHPSAMIVAMTYEYLVPTALSTFDGVLDIYEDEPTIARQLAAIHRRRLSKSGTGGLGDILTLREKEILAEIHEGRSSAQIAEKFSISVNTVKSHRKSLCQKTKSTSAAERAAYLLIHKLI